MSDFVHLRIHSEYSLVDGLVRIKQLIAKCQANQMQSVAITDHGNLCSYIKFYKAAIKAGVKPICGADLWLDIESEEPSRITLLVMNEIGYRNLTELISEGWLTGQKDGKPLVKQNLLLEKAQGLIALSGGKEGIIGKILLSNNKSKLDEFTQNFKSAFDERFYLEIERTNHPQDEQYIKLALKLARKHDLPLVATNGVCFLEQDEFDAHETRVCIAAGVTLDDESHNRNYTQEQYFKSAEQMEQLFADIPESITNTVEIAKRCNFKVETGKTFLPNFKAPDNEPVEQYLNKVAFAGLGLKINQSNVNYDKYKQRLEFELNTIINMGFAGYFLIVADFIKWAKSNGIPVGPGRGSGAGSLVAYVLNITDLDPLAYDLLFERFLNPERVSMPDFDIDFCIDGRDKVIEYVAQKYGKEAVGQIITFGSMAAKAVVRDVTRALGKPYALGDKLAKLIPFELDITLAKARTQESALNDLLNSDEEADEVWQLSLKLEGLTRNFGKHAGGVVIAPTKLTDFSPIICDEFGANVVTQFDKKDVEEVGLVKFDFLGLRTLTIIKWALEFIEEQSISIDINQIPLNDAKTFAMLQKAETNAVFQLESRGMKDLVKRLKPDCLEDIIALVALFRPGPLGSGMVDDFIERKHGKKPVSYPHANYQLEILKPILAPTYGVVLYQEQVMQIAQVMAGYSLGQADILRRAMGKKDAHEMAMQREGFVKGCNERGINSNLAANIFDLVESFAGYGFNKSHSAAYGLIAYQTAYLKAHFPACFMAAVLSSEMHNTDKIVSSLEECANLNIKVLTPCVNRSGYRFSVNKDNQIIYGLGAIKGIGEGPSFAIENARNTDGLFKDLFDFCKRVDLKRVNKRTIENLILSGALDNLTSFKPEQTTDFKRALLLACMESAVQAAEQEITNQNLGLQDLFGNLAPVSTDVYANFKKIKPMTLVERLHGEKTTLGRYLSGHPLDDFMVDLNALADCKIADLIPNEQEKTIAGMLISQRILKNKKGEKIAFIILDDKSAQIEISLFAKVYLQFAKLLTLDTVLVVQGVAQNDDYTGKVRFLANKILTLDEARNTQVKRLKINLDSKQISVSKLMHLKDVLHKNAGNIPVVMEYKNDKAVSYLRFSDKWQVNAGLQTLHEVRAVFSEVNATNIIFDY